MWNVDPAGKTDEQIAEEGLAAMECWMKELGLVMHLKELGVNEGMVNGLVRSTLVMQGGYKVLTEGEIRTIFMESL